MLYIVLIEGEKCMVLVVVLPDSTTVVTVTGNCGYCSVVVTAAVMTVVMCGVML